MDTFLTLIRREWMQHRFGWMLLVTVPLALALLGLVVGQIEFDSETAEKVGPAFPTLLGMIAMTAGTVVTFTILGATSLLLLTGLARRDHADRSVEFWLSLPTSHTASLAAPLVTHLLLVPAAALVVGLVGGWVISGALVTRLTGFGSWLALPWADLLLAGIALVLRIMAGLPLAVLWAAPLLLAVPLRRQGRCPRQPRAQGLGARPCARWRQQRRRRLRGMRWPHRRHRRPHRRR